MKKTLSLSVTGVGVERVCVLPPPVASEGGPLFAVGRVLLNREQEEHSRFQPRERFKEAHFREDCFQREIGRQRLRRLR